MSSKDLKLPENQRFTIWRSSKLIPIWNRIAQQNLMQLIWVCKLTQAKKSEINRTVINLPGETKKVKVGVVCEENKSQEAKDAGAEVVGGDEFIEEINQER